MLQIVYFIFYPLFTVKRVPPLLTSQWISLTIQGDGLEAHPVGITSRAEKSSTYYILHLQSSTRLCTDTANFMGPGQWEGNSDSETSDSKDKVSSYRYSQVLPSARLSATSSGRSNKTTRSTPLLGAVAWKGKKYISIEKKTHIINWNMNAIRKCRLLKGSLSINALRACVYINIQQLGSFRATTWFIDLTVATCHIQYTFLSLCQFFSGENGQNTKILEVRHIRMTWKWPPTFINAKH